MNNVKYELDDVMINLGIISKSKEHKKEELLREIEDDKRLLKLNTLNPEVRFTIENELKFHIEELKQL